MNTIKLNTIGERPIKKVAGGGGNYVYYRAGVDKVGKYGSYASVVKAIFDGSGIFVAYYDAKGAGMDILEWRFDVNLKVTNPKDMALTTVGEFIAEPSQSWTQITEEEFYKVELPMRIDFGYVASPYNDNEVGVVPFTHDEGMTWREWLSSPYNTLEEVGFPMNVEDFDGELHLWGSAHGGTFAWQLMNPDGNGYALADDVIENKQYQMQFAG